MATDFLLQICQLLPSQYKTLFKQQTNSILVTTIEILYNDILFVEIRIIFHIEISSRGIRAEAGAPRPSIHIIRLWHLGTPKQKWFPSQTLWKTTIYRYEILI